VGRRASETSNRFLGAAVLALTAALLLPVAASASFHLNKIREVYTGTGTGALNDAYVEIQAFGPGENLLTGHEITVYDAAGNLVDTAPLENVPNGANQSTTLVSGGGVLPGGVTADFTHDTLDASLDRNGGAVCYDGIPYDCVAWGNFVGETPLPGATGNPVAPAGIPNGSSIIRSIAPGCATLLEGADDTDDSATDFSVTTDKNPRPNSEPPIEKACGGGGGGGGGNAPQTNIDKGPKKKTTKATAKFKFSSPDAGATFECSLDGKAFKSCDSPLKLKHVKPGKHVFSVRAVVDDVADKSPATMRWKRVVKKG
jgi:hypothetical protein